MSRHNDPNATAGDPDIAHLYDLLRMLPGPAEDREFWANVQSAWQGKPLPAEPANESVAYVYEKMARITLLLREPTPERIVYLCHYLLVFFADPNPEMWRILSHITAVDFSISQDHGGTGRLWAEDITKTAWALLVRYDRFGDEKWKDKWHFEDNWTEWRPLRDE